MLRHLYPIFDVMGMASSKDNETMVDVLVRRGTITKPEIERAFRLADRGRFVPKSLAEAAYKENPLKKQDDEGGQFYPGPLHLSTPDIYARVLGALDLEPGQSFLNVGSGTGWLNTAVGFIIGDEGINHGIEHYRNLVNYANERNMETLEETHAHAFPWAKPKFFCMNVLWPEFLKNIQEQQYDRIYVGACLNDRRVIDKLVRMLKVGGKIVIPTVPHLVRFTRVSETKAIKSLLLRSQFTDLIVPPEDYKSVEFPVIEKIPTLAHLCRKTYRQNLRRTINRNGCNPVVKQFKGYGNFSRSFLPSRTQARQFYRQFEWRASVLPGAESGAGDEWNDLQEEHVRYDEEGDDEGVDNHDREGPSGSRSSRPGTANRTESNIERLNTLYEAERRIFERLLARNDPPRTPPARQGGAGQRRSPRNYDGVWQPPRATRAHRETSERSLALARDMLNTQMENLRELERDVHAARLIPPPLPQMVIPPPPPPAHRVRPPPHAARFPAMRDDDDLMPMDFFGMDAFMRLENSLRRREPARRPRQPFEDDEDEGLLEYDEDNTPLRFQMDIPHRHFEFLGDDSSGEEDADLMMELDYEDFTDGAEMQRQAEMAFRRGHEREAVERRRSMVTRSMALALPASASSSSRNEGTNPPANTVRSSPGGTLVQPSLSSSPVAAESSSPSSSSSSSLDAAPSSTRAQQVPPAYCTNAANRVQPITTNLREFMRRRRNNPDPFAAAYWPPINSNPAVPDEPQPSNTAEQASLGNNCSRTQPISATIASRKASADRKRKAQKLEKKEFVAKRRRIAENEMHTFRAMFDSTLDSLAIPTNMKSYIRDLTPSNV